MDIEKGITVVITGASRGIGQVCAIKLANPLNTLILMGRNVEDLEETKAACEKLGAKVTLSVFDLSDIPEIKNEVQKIKEQHEKVDVLINNAGIWLKENFLEGSMEAWDKALDVNLRAPMHLTRHFVEDMTSGGAVIFIGSTASKRGYRKGTNYCAAKYGMLGFASALFEEVRDSGIKVCTIMPGIVNTDMQKDNKIVPKEKMLQAEDIANAVLYVLNSPSNVCPTELLVQPQYNH